MLFGIKIEQNEWFSYEEDDLKTDTKPERKYYLDILRIISTLAVIILHVSSTYMDRNDSSSDTYYYLNMWNCITHWAVGMFVMISGALFLNDERKCDFKRLYSHNIGHIVRCFVFWSLLYTILTVTTNLQDDSIETFVSEFIKGHYHMWFLFMIIGVYMMVPLVKAIIADWKLTNYFCIFILIFSFIIPSISNLIGQLEHFGVIGRTGVLYENINYAFDHLILKMPTGYLGYFVLGYWLSNVRIKDYQKIILYVAGILSFIAIEAIPVFCHYQFGEMWNVGGDFSLIGIIFSSALFIWMREHIKVTQARFQRIIRHFSGISFGVYLAHAGIIEVLDIPLGINAVLVNPFVGVVITTTLVVIIASVGISIQKIIPLLKKYC